MSFSKASDLLRLAEMATARYGGVGLADIEAEFGVDRRTAQRMTRALEATFSGCTTGTDAERREMWRLNAADARDGRGPPSLGLRRATMSAPT